VIYKEARSNVVKKADLDPKFANVPVILKKTDDHPLPKAAPSMKHKPLIMEWTKEDAKPYDADTQGQTVVTEHTTVVVEGVGVVKKIDDDDEDDNTPLSIEDKLDETTPGKPVAAAASPQGEPDAADAATAILKSKMVETLGKLSAVLEQFQQRQDQDEAALNQVKSEMIKMEAVREAAKLIAKEEVDAVVEHLKEEVHADTQKLVDAHRQEVNTAIEAFKPAAPKPAEAEPAPAAAATPPTPVVPPSATESSPPVEVPPPASPSASSSSSSPAEKPAETPVTTPAAEAAKFAEILNEAQSETASESEAEADEESPEFDKLQSTSEAILDKVSSVDRDVTALADPHMANTKSLADLQVLEGRLDSLLKRQSELEQSHQQVTSVVNDDLEGHTPADQVRQDAAATLHETHDSDDE